MNQSDGRDRQIVTLREQLSRLSDASLRIDESLDLDDVLQGVLDSARILTGARYGVITTLDDQGGIEDLRVSGLSVEERVDSGRGQNRALRPLSALWPTVFAGEQDVAPPKGRDVGQKLGLNGQAGESPLSDRFAEMGGIPVNDDGSEQVEPGHAVVLTLAGAVAYFALAPDA